MSLDTLPLSLYRANSALQLRIARLLQDNGHRWLNTVRAPQAGAMANTATEISALLHSTHWHSLAALPLDSFWRLFQARPMQPGSLHQRIIEDQADFTRELQLAIDDWRNSVMAAMSMENPPTGAPDKESASARQP